MDDTDRAEPTHPAAPQARGAFAFKDVPRLTAALKAGDESAFAWLHSQWSARISRYSFALAGGDETFAGEIAQSAWLRLVRHVRVLDDERALWNWIACAARHAAADLRRTGGRYHRMLSRFAEWWQPRSSAVPDDCRLSTALESALAKLDCDDRSLIEARYLAGQPLEMIGARRALSVRAVEGRLARLRVRLRELIAVELKATR